jgi:hypothetical protein
MTAPRTGPVTYGQLSVLRSLRIHGPDGQTVANLINFWAVPPGVETAHVADAWLRLVEAHESLRTTYDQQDATPTQTVQPFRAVRITTVELAEDTAVAAERAARELAATPIAIDQGLPWRARVATYQGDPVYLVAVVHHVAADNDALRVLESQFHQLLAGGTVTPECQPLDLALAQRADQAAARRSIGHWTGTWNELLDEDRHPDDASERRRASVYSVEGLAAAREISARLKISVQSVLFGVGVLAVARLERRDRVTFALMSANRLEPRWASLVGSLNQYAPVTVLVDESADPLAFLRDTYTRCLTAYLNGCYDVDLLTRSLRQAGCPEPDPTAFAKHFNFLGDVGPEPDADSPARTGASWRPSTQRTGPNLHLAMAVGKGVLIGVGASRDYLDGTRPALLAASIEAGLLNIATATSLREVRLDPIRTT